MNQELLDRIMASPRLPSLPTIAIQVINLVQQKDVKIKEIADTIQNDPALSSKILKTVNSSLYGQAHSISTISHALVVLGLNGVKTLALGFSLTPQLTDSADQDFDHRAYWKRSLYAAVAARAVAKQAGLAQQEEAFLGGLLQDVGLLTMSQTLGDEYTQLLAKTQTAHKKLAGLERETMDIDHAVVGAALCDMWQLPPLLVAPIRYHEDPESSPEEHQSIVHCLALGSVVASICLDENPGDALESYYKLGEEWFNLSRDDAEPLLKAVHDDTVEARQLFDLPTGELENVDEIIARANDALMQISLEQQHQSDQLAQQNRQLSEQANTDGLTGVANRRRFNDFLAEKFRGVQGGDGPLTVVLCDVDHFKQFNDAYGHQIGDRVLVEVAYTMKKSAPVGTLVARYGGEEFAMVMPSINRVSGAKLAESLRKLIEVASVQADEGQLSVTASIGVSSHDGSYFTTVEQLIKAADQAVYAAKNAGRNCVRIFSPRPGAKAA